MPQSSGHHTLPAKTPVSSQTPGTRLRTQVLLTPKELEVMKWGALGKTSSEIACILDCTVHTVNFHFTNIRRKFDVSSRNMAMLRAMALGMLAP